MEKPEFLTEDEICGTLDIIETYLHRLVLDGPKRKITLKIEIIPVKDNKDHEDHEYEKIGSVRRSKRNRTT